MNSKKHLPIHHATNPSRTNIRKIILVALLSVFTFIATATGIMYYNLQASVKTVNVDKLLKKTNKPVDSYDGKALNILVIGSDVRTGENARFGNDEGMRSDTTLLVHISADRKHTQVVSIARDILTNIPECPREDGSTVPAMYAQFNTAFAYGGMDGNISSAAACTIRTVEAMSGLNIDEFVVIDFSGFINVVDSLGGVEYCFEEAVNDPLSGLHVDAGCQKLNGFQALALARARYSLGDGSDVSRIGRQQQLVFELIKTAKSKNILTDISSLYSFAKTSLSTLTTSERIGSLSTMGGIAYSLRNIKNDNIQFITLPVHPAPQDINRLVVSPEGEQLWQLIKEDKPVPNDFSGLKNFNSEKQNNNEQAPENNQTENKTN